ncbi:hypothetical protein AX15_001939 [Amanita polypyramis BW_CC]|nr:hypothetical protein AX15_001939 [Amanita polypyramis BW_CC]
MPIDFSTYITQLNDSLVEENGPTLAYLLRPTSPHGKDLVKEFRNPTRALLNRYKGSMVTPWDEISIQYVLVCTHVAKRRQAEAFQEHSSLVSLFFKFFVENKGWTLPALFSVLRDLRDLAHDADYDARCNSQKSDFMEEAARIISKAFTSCMTDRTSPPDQSRKWGVYYVAGLIMKCYFRVKRISLSKNILRALEVNTDVPPLSAFPRSHQVTYRYYIGMISFLNEDYANAEGGLTLAFYHCHTGSYSNQTRILTYLIPLRILKGHLPSEELLNRFPILRNIFTPFISAIRKGDLAAFDKALESNERRLVELSLWLIVEKTRELCMRGLFRRVWVATEKSSRIPISMFHSSLRISGIDLSQQEAECFVAIMIYKRYMLGYISHEKQMVVLALSNPFPRVADRPSPFSLI